MNAVRRKLHAGSWLPAAGQRLVVTLAVTFLVGWLDILGVHGHLEELSDRIAQRVLAPLHGAEKGQQEIKVVLIDPAFLRRGGGLHVAWPLPAKVFLDDILAPIMEAGPKAVFIDVSFTDMPRALVAGGPADDDALRTLGEGIRTLGGTVPVFLASGLPVGSRRGGCSDDAVGWVDRRALADSGTTSRRLVDAAVAGKDRPVEMVAANWLGGGSEYPVGAAVVSRPDSCLWVLQDRDAKFRGEAVTGAGGFLLSPASAIYKQVYCPHKTGDRLCDGIKALEGPSRNAGFGLYAPAQEFDRPMLVSWRTRITDTMRRRLGRGDNADSCLWQTGARAPLDFAMQSLRAFLPAVEQVTGHQVFERPCYYFDTFSAEDVRNSELSDQEGDDSLFHHLKNSVVMIGTDLPTVRDEIETPFDVEMPGVFLHAMALDNFLAHGAGYPRRPEGYQKFLELVEEAALVGLLGWFTPRLARRLGPGRQARTWWRIVKFTFVLLMSSFVMFVATVLISLGIGRLLGFLYFGGPFYMALTLSLVLTEDLNRIYFGEHGEAGHQKT